MSDVVCRLDAKVELGEGAVESPRLPALVGGHLGRAMRAAAACAKRVGWSTAMPTETSWVPSRTGGSLIATISTRSGNKSSRRSTCDTNYRSGFRVRSLRTKA